MKSLKTIPFLAVTLATFAIAIGLVQWQPAPKPQARATSEQEENALEMRNAGEAVAWRNLTLQGGPGKAPAGARLQALEQRKANIEYWERNRPKLAELDRTDWVQQGPFTAGGRTRAISVDPSNTNNILAGSVSGGIFRSTDKGVTWTASDDYMSNLAISSIVRDPANPQIVYAGSGEGHFNIDAVEGIGVFKSTNGGVSWSLLPGSSAWVSFNRLAISPSNSNIMLASTRWGGILRSADAGNTWTTVRSADASFDVEFNPTNGNLAVGHTFTGNTQRAVYSTDAGQTWTTSTGALSGLGGFNARIELAYAPSSPNIVYGSSSGVVYRSTDGGQSYIQMTQPGQGTSVDWYNNGLWVSPNDPNFVIVSGVHLSRSLDGGATFVEMGNGYASPFSPHPDMHYVIEEPGYNGTTNRTIYVGTDGGVYRTADALNATNSSGWTNLNFQSGYVTTQFYGAQGHGPSGKIVGGTQDNGTWMLSVPTSAESEYFGGDGGWCAVDPTDPNYTYGEYVYLKIHRSTDGGATASYIYNGLTDAQNNNANFIAPFILDPNDPNRMLAGGMSLWRSSNVKTATPTWSAIRASSGSAIGAIAVAKTNSAIVWVGLGDGRIAKTTNGLAGSPTWSYVDDNSAKNPLPNRYVTRIFIDPSNANLVYVAFGGWNSDNLWKSADGGTTWQDISGSGPTGLPSTTVRGIARHPNNPDWLYVGTEVGVFSSETQGNIWSTTNDGPASVSVDELSFMSSSNTLLAATHGRGIYTANLDPTATVLSVTLSPSSVPIGTSTTGTVTISSAPGTDGRYVGLTASNTAAQVPAYVKVNSGATTANFAVTTTPAPATTANTTITARIGTSTKTTVLTIIAPLNSAYKSQSVPTSVYVGQPFTASVNMKNTGTDTWTEATKTRLGSQNPANNTTWGYNRFNIPGATSVLPNGSYNFSRTFIAPVTPGTYNFRWRMIKDGVGSFGQTSPNVAINVVATARASQFISQSVPTSVTAGASFSATVTMKNLGTTAWTEATKFRLCSQNPTSNTTWGSSRMNIAGATSVATGVTYAFTKTFVAPSTPGTYNFQWRMIQDGGPGVFGQYSPNVAITVLPPPMASEYISQSVPTSVAAGATFTASVTMKNTGSDTWTEAAKYRLCSQNPTSNTTWTYNRINIPGATSVPTGSTYVFSRSFKAPSTPGTYNFQWRMIKDGVGLFGPTSPNVVITVN